MEVLVLHIDLVRQLLIRCPVGEMGSRVVERMNALERFAHGLPVADIAIDPLHIKIIDIARIAALSHQDADLFSIFEQFSHDGRTDKSCGARHQIFHSSISPHWFDTDDRRITSDAFNILKNTLKSHHGEHSRNKGPLSVTPHAT